MRKTSIKEGRVCPKCGSIENQKDHGYNCSKKQRCLCKNCNRTYTLNPKTKEYPEETGRLAMKMYYSEMSGRGAGKILGMSNANVYNWIKKTNNNVDNTPTSAKYFADGWSGYVDIVYPGRYIRNARDKSDTFTVEDVNADLRHYIPILARRSRCFARKLETLKAVVDIFVDAYNRFGRAKCKYRLTHEKGEVPFALVDFL